MVDPLSALVSGEVLAEVSAAELWLLASVVLAALPSGSFPEGWSGGILEKSISFKT